MERSVRLILLTTLLSALSSLPAGGAVAALRPGAAEVTNYEVVTEAVSRIVKKEMRKHDVIGLSIALVDDQRIVWSQGFGYADKKAGIRASPETIYRIGSLTELFTVTAALQLADQGLLDIDHRLRSILPEFMIPSRFAGDGGAGITLRHLMTHHAGLPYSVQKGLWSTRPEPFTSLLERLRYDHAAYPLGTVFSYSSAGTTLLGHAMERRTGRPYVSVVHDSLLGPLGMERSGFLPAPAREQVAKGYHDEQEMEDPLPRDTPAAGMYSTVLDLARFLQMVFNNGSWHGTRVLRPASLAEMLRPQNAGVPLDRDIVVGLGWMLSGLGEIDIRDAGTVAHHAGATILFRGQMIALPDQKLGVVVLANTSKAARVVNTAAARAIAFALEAKRGISQLPASRSEQTDRALPHEVLQDYAGQFTSMAGLVRITPRSDHLHAEVMQRTLQLLPLADGRFGIRFRLFGLIPISLGELDLVAVSRASIAGREVILARLKERELVVAEKVRPVPVPDAWLRRLGEYRIGNLGDDAPLLGRIGLRYEHGLLLAEVSAPVFFKGSVRYPLTPLSDTEAVVAGIGRGMGETIRIVDAGGREALRYSGYVLVPEGTP